MELLLFAVALPFWLAWSVHRGLRLRSRPPVVIDRLSLAAVVRARLAENDNWTESKLVEDALTLFDRRGRRLAKVPRSAVGFEALVADLERRGIAIEHVLVSAPAFLD